MTVFAAAALVATGMVTVSAQSESITGEQTVYYNSSGQSVLNATTNYSARDNGDGTFLINIADILASTMTQMTGVYLESGFDVLIDGAPTVTYQLKGTPGTVTVPGANFAVASSNPVESDDIFWTGTSVSVTADGYGSGLDNAHRMVLTFKYAKGVFWEEVAAVMGGYSYRIATLVENYADVEFAASSGPLGNPDGGSGGSAIPTPSAIAGGLGLLGLAGLKRRRDA